MSRFVYECPDCGHVEDDWEAADIHRFANDHSRSHRLEVSKPDSLDSVEREIAAAERAEQDPVARKKLLTDDAYAALGRAIEDLEARAAKSEAGRLALLDGVALLGLRTKQLRAMRDSARDEARRLREEIQRNLESADRVAELVASREVIAAAGVREAKLVEDLHAAKMTAEEGREIVGELTTAIAALFGEDLKPCAGSCVGHLGEKASSAVRNARWRWEAIESERDRLLASNRGLAEELEAERCRLKIFEEANDGEGSGIQAMGRLNFKLTAERDRLQALAARSQQAMAATVDRSPVGHCGICGIAWLELPTTETRRLFCKNGDCPRNALIAALSDPDGTAAEAWHREAVEGAYGDGQSAVLKAADSILRPLTGTEPKDCLSTLALLDTLPEWHREEIAKAYNSGLEAAAQIVRPEPHIEEERSCREVAVAIRGLALDVMEVCGENGSTFYAHGPRRKTRAEAEVDLIPVAEAEIAAAVAKALEAKAAELDKRSKEWTAGIYGPALPAGNRSAIRADTYDAAARLVREGMPERAEEGA